MRNLLEELISTLQIDERLVLDGKLVKNKIIELSLSMDEKLLEILLTNENIKKQFFQQVGNSLVFDKVAFQNFVSNKEFLPDSYTSFKNKIGLTSDRTYLTESKEVVLAWPYKDCVLEGGQNQEDQKRDEIFWNQTLASDEIDRLFEPKVLTNFRKYNKSGEHVVNDITLEDNLLIKGNNLLALHSLKSEYAGKVKLIYIDPPYNTGGGGDTFEYNNTFKHSTWLTFMKNRLEIAKNFLTEDGVLIVAIDENECARLGVLLEEIFEEYDVHCITIVHNPRGVQGANFSYTHEYAYFVLPSGQKSIGNKKIEESEITWSQLRNWGGESTRESAKNCFYPVIVEEGAVIGFGDVSSDEEHPSQTEERDGKYYVYPIDNKGIERKWRYARQSVEEVKHLLRAKETDEGYQIELGKDFGQYRTVWQNPKYDANKYGTQLIKELVPGCSFSFPKSLWNVYDCLHAVVGEDKNAIVLDFHAGSGTTAHAVIELNKEDGGHRKYILCEQMDYVESVTAKRIQAVLKQEDIENDFIYFELKEHNAILINEIQQAANAKVLKEILGRIENESFISYKIHPEAINENTNEFEKLLLDEQKQFLIETLDKNQLFINYYDIDDQEYQISDEDKELNKQFYESCSS